MPRTINEGFTTFLARLTPTATETKAAISHRASIKQCLESNFGLIRFFRMGSFGNGTSISKYSDVDYLACLPRDELNSNSTHSLTKVRNALNTRFPNTGVRVNCPAVMVPFGDDKSEATEVVPADEIGESNGYKIYDIPDCSGGWMRSSPDAHNDYVRAIDNDLGGKVKPLIRFVKAWNFYRNARISSFYLELRVAEYADAQPSIIYSWDVARVLETLLSMELRNIRDPMGVSGYISACTSDAQREAALSKLVRAVDRSAKARECEDEGDIKGAFEWWDKVYNHNFPSYYY